MMACRDEDGCWLMGIVLSDGSVTGCFPFFPQPSLIIENVNSSRR